MYQFLELLGMDRDRVVFIETKPVGAKTVLSRVTSRMQRRGATSLPSAVGWLALQILRPVCHGYRGRVLESSIFFRKVR